MGVIIKNEATEAKIRKLAKRTGETLTQAVERAVDERLARTKPVRRKGRVDRAKLARVIAYFRSLPKQNEHLTDDEIVGYGPDGLPR
jgi:antitoxin VapB